ncbi:hypothetical protein B0H14DRAFT_2604647 [Mycena olivaceomarginata]|nr:hypothetical protein B0H14DRAFT_2604647 [Mycena olivaceomarginata]
MVLVMGCSVIQIPAVQRSAVYPWFIFQPTRFYRVILVLAISGNMYGQANMTLFLILVNLIAVLVLVQFLRGDLSADQKMNFGTLFNAFLAIYQVFGKSLFVSGALRTIDAGILAMLSMIPYAVWGSGCDERLALPTVNFLHGSKPDSSIWESV